MATKKNLVQSMFMNILTAGIFATAFTACSDDLSERDAFSGSAMNGESFELTSLEQYSYSVPVQVTVQGDWEIDLRFSDENNKFCYALPNKGHGPATIKLCMLDNWTEKRNEGQMIIRDLNNNREAQSFRLMQKSNLDNPNYEQARACTRGEGEAAKDGEAKEEKQASAANLMADQYKQGLRTKAVGYGYNVTMAPGPGAVSLNPIIALEKLAASGNDAGAKTGGCQSSYTVNTYSGSSYDELYSNVAFSAEGKANKGGLAVELKASYSQTQKSATDRMFVYTTVDANITNAYLSGLDGNHIREFLTDNARAAIDGEGVYATGDAGFAQLLKDYGSHLIMQSDLGGHIRYTSTVAKTLTERKDSASAYAKCSYKNKIIENASASVSAQIARNYSSNTASVETTVKAFGGDPKVSASVGKSEESVNAWLESLGNLENLMAVGIGDDPDNLIPLYKLIDTSTEEGRQRSELLKQYMENGTAEVMAFDGTENSQTSDVFHITISSDLQTANGYAAKHEGTLVYEAWAYNKVVAMICKEYIPQISNEGLVLTVYPVTDNKADFKNGRFLGNDIRRPSRITWTENGNGKAVLKELGNDFSMETDLYLRGSQIFTYKPSNGRIIEAKIKGKYLKGEKATSDCNVTFGIATADRWHWNSDRMNLSRLYQNPDLKGLKYDKSYQYPLVKFGTHIWTRENYNGNVPHGASKDERYGSRIENGEAFFTFKSIAKASFPTGWHAGKAEDYNELRAVLVSDGVKTEFGSRMQEEGASGFELKWTGWYVFEHHLSDTFYDSHFYYNYEHKCNGTAAEYLLPGKGHIRIRDDKFEVCANEKQDYWAMQVRLVMD